MTAPLAGECARCLDPFTAETTVRFQELYTLEEGAAAAVFTSPRHAYTQALLAASPKLPVTPLAGS